MARKLNTDESIVDYLASIGVDNSKENRKKLAGQYGMKDYNYTADDNTYLMELMKNGNASTPSNKTQSKSQLKMDTVSKPKASTNVEMGNIAKRANQSLGGQVPQQNLPVYEQNAPSPYRSAYSAQIDNILDGILNGQQFNYNINSDPLYKQMNEQYSRNANLGMRDAMGNAAALTGGYGNSYAAVAGQQTYDAYMNQLNDRIPELYQAAYDRYQNDQANKMNQLAVMQGLDQQAYGQYRDSVGDWQNNRDYGYMKDQDVLSQQNYLDQFDYQKSQDDLAQQNYLSEFDYKKSQDELAQKNYQNEFTYQKSQDKLAQNNFERELGQSQSEFNREMSYKQSQAAQQQSNYNREFAYQKEQDALDREDYFNEKAAETSEKNAQESIERIDKYSQTAQSMLSEQDGFGSPIYSADQVMDYLMGLDLTDEEIAMIANENYELRKYVQG